MILAGFHAVSEAVQARPRRVEWVLFDEARRDRRSGELKRICREQRIPIRYGRADALDRLARHHQGVVGRIAAADLVDETAVLAGQAGARLVFALDGIEDPQNLGAILRVAEAAGASVVSPQRGGAPLSDAVARVSAGAVERVAIHRTVNLARFLSLCRDEGFFVVGLEARAGSLYELDLRRDVVLVLGAEGRGLRRLVRDRCDVLAALPMLGSVASLNVSTAAAAAAFEIIRQKQRPSVAGI